VVSAGARSEATVQPSKTGARRLRVVYLDHVAELSGGELALLRLLRALGDVQAHVILASDGPLVGRLRQEGIAVEVMEMAARTAELRKEALRPGSLPLSAVADTALYARALAARLRALGPDLVHANSLKSGLYGSLAARIAGIPLVWHLRDRLAADYLPAASLPLLRAAVRHLPAVVICNSTATRQTLGRCRRVLVIPSLVEPVVCQPPKLRPAGEPLAVGIIGRIAPWKGQDVFLRAFARAFADRPHRAVIVGAPLFGDRERDYERSLHALARELGIAERVQFRGHRDDIAAELASLDVLVHASTVPEPFGQVVIEGMSAGLPVVAAAAGGPAEIITDGRDGLLYQPGDVEALATALTRLDGAPMLRARLAANAPRRAQDFSPERIAAQMMAAYRRVCARADRPASEMAQSSTVEPGARW
jgi:glycosyltransferase involved in cell wall biosynthesis